MDEDEIARLEAEVSKVENSYFWANAGRSGQALIAYAKACVAAGRRISIREYTHFAAGGGSPQSDHNDEAIVSRLLLERLPECRKYVSLRRSRFDRVFARRPRYRAVMGIAVDDEEE